MSDYIEREAALQAITEMDPNDAAAKWAIIKVPDADVSSVRWISADEVLPPNGEDVLCWYEYYRYGEYNRMFQTFGIGYQYNGNWGGEVATGQKAKVLAWMPLPDAPKMDGGDERAAD